ncbi:MAG: hypothetical protein V4549_04180 [Bacteroidota bacterium]
MKQSPKNLFFLSSISSNGLPVNITAVNGTSVYSAIPVKQQ